MAPAGTPATVVQVLGSAMQRVVQSPEHTRQFVDFSVVPALMDPEAHTRFWMQTERRMAPILRSIRPN